MTFFILGSRSSIRRRSMQNQRDLMGKRVCPQQPSTSIPASPPPPRTAKSMLSPDDGHSVKSNLYVKLTPTSTPMTKITIRSLANRLFCHLTGVHEYVDGACIVCQKVRTNA